MASASSDIAAPRPLGLISLVLVLGTITTLLDSTIVNIAIDHLATTFDASVADVQWVATAYLLAFVSVIPVSGWLAERLGARRVWIIAIAVFLLGSLLCGFAWDLPSLIGFRVLQGLGGGLVLPVAITILSQAAGPDRMAHAMVAIGLPGQLAPILGPVIGGAIIESWDWHWLFFVNVPICIAALILSPLFLPAASGRPGHRFDLLGFVLLTPAVSLLAFGVSQAVGVDGFAAPSSWMPLAGGAVLLAGFVIRSLAAKGAALIDVRVFRRRSFGLSSVITFVAGFSLYAIMFLLPLFYQNVRGRGIFETGLLLIPQGVGTILFLLAYRRWLATVDARFVVGGGVVLTMLGILPFALSGTDGSESLLLVGQFVQGIGLGAASIPVMTMAMASLSHDETPRGSAAFSVVQRVGAPFGVAVIAVILQAYVGGSTTADAILPAFQATFWWVIALSIVPLLLAFFIPRLRRAPADAVSEEAVSEGARG